MQQQAYAEMQRVSGQVDVLQTFGSVRIGFVYVFKFDQGSLPLSRHPRPRYLFQDIIAQGFDPVQESSGSFCMYTLSLFTKKEAPPDGGASLENPKITEPRSEQYGQNRNRNRWPRRNRHGCTR